MVWFGLVVEPGGRRLVGVLGSQVMSCSGGPPPITPPGLRGLSARVVPGGRALGDFLSRVPPAEILEIRVLEWTQLVQI